MRLIFAGTTEFAKNILEVLIDGHKTSNQSYTPIALLTAPDRPAGRGQKNQISAVKHLYNQHNLNIPLLQPHSLEEDQHAYDAIKELQADILLVVAYGYIIPATWLALPRYGSINVHASLLPRWRGAAPIERAIISGDQTTGVTIIQMNEIMDAGAILLQKSCTIDNQETATSLTAKLQDLAVSSTIETLNSLTTTKPPTPQVQDPDKITFAPKIQNHEHQLDWSANAADLERKIRALNARGNAYFNITITTPKNTKENIKIKVITATAQEHNANQPSGTVLDATDTLLIACGQGALQIKTIKLPAKARNINIVECRHGHRPWFEGSHAVFSPYNSVL